MDTNQLEAELQSLDRDIASYEKQIAYYEKYGTLPEEPNFAYVFNFEFPGATEYHIPQAAPAVVTYPLQQRTVTIKKNTVFKVKSFSQAFTVVGTRSGVTQAAEITLARTITQLVFGYRFKFRDTGGDREWQDDWVNGNALLTGNYNGLRFRRGHALCSPGAEVTLQVDARSFGNNSTYTNLGAINTQRLQIVMAGFETEFPRRA